MPNFSGIWTITQQMQAKGASTWPATPGAPTIGTATAGTSQCASVTFTAPGCSGYPASVTGYRVVSTPGCFTATGASSPLTVTGLTVGTSYTFKAQATNASGYGALSCASNSITATVVTSQAYTSPGTYSWVAPSGVTAVSVVAIGAGGFPNTNSAGGGGGGLAYKNNISVTPGNSYTVVVSNGDGTGAGSSYFSSTSVVNATRGSYNGTGGTYTAGDGGGTGGAGGTAGGSCYNYSRGGGGAAGYAGTGGTGASYVGTTTNSTAGSGGGGGGGGASGGCFYCPCANTSYTYGGAGGGGVGLFGQGSSGTGGNTVFGPYGGQGGFGGSSGGNGNGNRNNTGGYYGGGGGTSFYYNPYDGFGWRAWGTGNGGTGAVRIVWCVGGVRGTPSFPSTNVGA